MWFGNPGLSARSASRAESRRFETVTIAYLGGCRPLLTEPPEPFAQAVLLERHGALAIGEDPDRAVDRLELVEVLCRTWRDALLIRAARTTAGIVVGSEGGDSREG